MYQKIKKISELKLKNSKTSEDKDRYYLISKILEDKECFKKIKTETAYKLLNDLDFKESEVKKIYNELIFNN